MTHTLPLESIDGKPLSPEQKSYLQGIFAGLQSRGVSFADVAVGKSPGPATPIEVEAENLPAEERIKRELHPLDAYGPLIEDAVANRAPDKENLFRFKWHGLFFLAPRKDGFMARLRIPAGILKSFQVRELARISSELTSGYLQVTTRANIQMRLIQPKDAPAVLTRIQGVGLHTRGAGGDNLRNITTNATAGLDAGELIDTIPLCQDLAQRIMNSREFYDLPRKFNIAIDSGGLSPSLEDTNDLGARAVHITESSGAISPGIYFRIAAGGATGHGAFANDLGVLVAPGQLVQVLLAMLRVYIAHGPRTNRKRARLKHLLESWPAGRFLAETEKLLGFELPRAKSEDSSDPLRDDSGSLAGGRAHIGVFAQKQPGLRWVGVALPAGQITPKQLSRLADLAENYGSGELRLTVWQNIVIPNVPEAFVETVTKAVVKMGLDWRQSPIRSGLVACTGNSFCKFAASNTKKHALELADYLEKRLPLDQPVNIHLTGCPHSCAQHYIGDIGLLGTTVKVAGEAREGYHVFVGGGFGEQRALGRQIFQGVSAEQLKPTIEKMLGIYLEKRQAAETFQQFTARHPVGELQELFSS